MTPSSRKRKGSPRLSVRVSEGVKDSVCSRVGNVSGWIRGLICRELGTLGPELFNAEGLLLEEIDNIVAELDRLDRLGKKIRYHGSYCERASAKLKACGVASVGDRRPFHYGRPGAVVLKPDEAEVSLQINARREELASRLAELTRQYVQREKGGEKGT